MGAEVNGEGKNCFLPFIDLAELKDLAVISGQSRVKVWQCFGKEGYTVVVEGIRPDLACLFVIFVGPYGFANFNHLRKGCRGLVDNATCKYLPGETY